MKKLVTISMALALMLMAANAYACGDKGKVDASAAKAEMTAADGSCGSDLKATSVEAGKSNEASVIATDAKSCPVMKSSSDKASVKDADSKSGSCASKASMKGESKAKSSKAGSAEAPQSKDSKPVVLMGDPAGSVSAQ